MIEAGEALFDADDSSQQKRGEGSGWHCGSTCCTEIRAVAVIIVVIAADSHVQQ